MTELSPPRDRRGVLVTWWVLVAVAVAAACEPVVSMLREWSSDVPRLVMEVIDEVDRDPHAITQGLELYGDKLFHSTGGYGSSTFRVESARDGVELARVELPPDWYGEGTTRVGDAWWQLTWREGVAVLRDADTLTVRDVARYDGQGWGLCHDPARGVLYMSDGSASLTVRDPRSFAVRGEVTVTVDGRPVDQLNELECVDGRVWANIRGSDRIVRLDPDSGNVDAIVDVDIDQLLSTAERARAGELNGIAWAGSDRFWLTGKTWPKRFLISVPDSKNVQE